MGRAHQQSFLHNDRRVRLNNRPQCGRPSLLKHTRRNLRQVPRVALAPPKEVDGFVRSSGEGWWSVERTAPTGASPPAFAAEAAAAAAGGASAADHAPPGDDGVDTFLLDLRHAVVILDDDTDNARGISLYNQRNEV